MRSARAILALYVLVWFNIVVPGHTRGQVTLEGSSADPNAEVHSCCGPAPGEKADTDSGNAPKKHCAVCFVAATYTVADASVVDLRPAGVVAVLGEHTDAQIFSREYPPVFFPTGPPNVASLAA